MKNLILVFLTFLTFNFAVAQECANGWLPFANGTITEHTNFNKKGKLESVNTTTVLDVTSIDGGERAEVLINVTDKKGKQSIPETTVYYDCKGDVYEMDMSDFFNTMTASLPEEVTMDISGVKLVYPKNMSIGDELPEGNAEFSATMMGMKLMSGKVKQINRKVMAEEKITVGAGTFDCVKISETIISTVVRTEVSFDVTTWISKGAGMVKQEMYRGDKLDSYTELTKFSK